MFKRIYIEITNVCNLNCDFCPTSDRLKKYMTKEEFETIIKKINKYTNHIYLHIKGDPLMHPLLDLFLKIAAEYNLFVNITTNARLLSSKIDIINNNRIRQINISLHSFSNIYEIEELLNVIDNIKDAYVSLRLWNDADNSDIINLLSSHYKKDINITSKRVKITDRIFIDNDILFKWPNMNIEIISNNGTCKGTKSQIGILVDGTVVPCCLDNNGDIKLGNIFETDLKTIINSSKFKEIKEGFNNNILVSELCKRCGYRKIFDK